jgi:hypothetical protein
MIELLNPITCIKCGKRLVKGDKVVIHSDGRLWCSPCYPERPGEWAEQSPPAAPPPTNCQNEPAFPGARTVVFSIRAPDMVCHQPTEFCATEEPHSWTACGEVSGDRGAAPPTDEMVKLVRDMIAADIVENGAGVRTLVVREALSAILSPGSTPLPPTPTLTTAQQGNVNELEMGDGLYYVAQEAAFAPGIVKEWPAVIKHPKDKNGRLVRRKWPKSGGLSQGEPTE